MSTTPRTAWRIVWLTQRRFWYCLLHSAEPITGRDGDMSCIGTRNRDNTFYVFGWVHLDSAAKGRK